MISYSLKTLLRSWQLFASIAKIMIPVMLLIQVAQNLGLVGYAGQILGPVMAFLNLPAEAGIIWATTIFTGLYGGLASLASLSATLDLSSGQLSALAVMMLIAHNIPVEQAIVQRAGASFFGTALLRITIAIVYGAAISWASYFTNWLNQAHPLDWLSGSQLIQTVGSNTYVVWLQTTAFTMLLTFSIILILVLVLDIFERLGITQLITRAITPVLRFSGLEPRAAPVTTIGVLLGLSYGGALIIEQAKEQAFSPRTRMLALSWLSLSHSLIEDTLLFVALGANLWVILVGRVILTLLIIAAIARFTTETRTQTSSQQI